MSESLVKPGCISRPFSFSLTVPSDSRHILSVGADCCMKVTDVQTGMVISSVKAVEEQR